MLLICVQRYILSFLFLLYRVLTTYLTFLCLLLAGHSKFWVGLRKRVTHSGPVLTWYDGTTAATNDSWVKIPDPDEYSHDYFDMLGTGCFVYDGAVSRPLLQTYSLFIFNLDELLIRKLFLANVCLITSATLV